MKTKIIGACAALALLGGSAGAAQAETWLFNYTDALGNAASGTFVTSGFGATQTITSITGMFTPHLLSAEAITGLSPYAGADQALLTTSTPNFTFAGISFSVSGGFPDLNLCACGDPLGDVIDSFSDPGGGGSTADPIRSFNLAAVPEPATWAMMIVGFGLLGGGLRVAAGRRERALA